MQKYTIKSSPIDGFAAEDAKAGEECLVINKAWFSSDKPQFHLYITSISNSFLNKIGLNIAQVYKFLIVQHKDLTADIYINDFAQAMEAKINRDVIAGEKIYAGDISDISGMKFPDIQINETDKIIYCCKINWKFGLYFNLKGQVNVEELSRELGIMHTELQFEDYKVAFAAEITEAKEENTAKGIQQSTFIITEGKTDWKHLQSALNQIKINPQWQIIEFDDDRGDTSTLRMCEDYSKSPHSDKYIFVFDRDNLNIIEKLNSMTQAGEDFQRWGNNIYSMMIPIPDHRQNLATVSIEHYYSDLEIRTENSEGKRLHFCNELKKEILPNGQIRWVEIFPDDSMTDRKISSDDAAKIFSQEGNPTGLSKAHFAENILRREPSFDNFDFDSFQKIFDVLNIVTELNIQK